MATRVITITCRFLAACLAAYVSAWPASVVSQIVIDRSDLVTLTADGFTSTVWAVDSPGLPVLQGIYDQVGPDQVFDFRSVAVLPPTTSTSTVLPSAIGTPGQDDPAFSDANHVVVRADSDAESWTYQTQDDLRFVEHGTVVVHDIDADGITDTTVILNQPADTHLTFPLEYGLTWSETFARTTAAGGTRNESTQDHEAVVDSWGRLVTPVGSASVLRVTETKVTTVDAGGANLQSILTLAVYYSTIGLSSVIVANEAGEVVAGAYTIHTVGGTGRNGLTDKVVQVGTAYPNPFQHRTTIRFDVAQPSFVSVRIHDSLGRRVATLFDGFVPAGRRRIDWAPRDVAGGIYVARISTKNGAFSRTVVYIPR